MLPSYSFLTLLCACTAAIWGLEVEVKAPVKYLVELTWEPHSPDGFERNMSLINGKFPGPRLELTQDDEVHFWVVNKMPYNTTIHFHGIEQHNTLWSDGVPGVTQRPIQPGESFLYKWTATQHGSYWYHAHSRGQIDDGLFGPILIHPRDSKEEVPFEKITDNKAEITALKAAQRNSKSLMVKDWRHWSSAELWELEKQSGVDIICPDSILVNGKGSVKCPSKEEVEDPGPMVDILDGQSLTAKGCVPPTVKTIQGDYPHDHSKLPERLFDKCVDTDGTHEVIEVDKLLSPWTSFDIVSAAGLDVLTVSIDEHPMWVYAVDGHYIEPYLVHAIQVDPGARYSVFVKIDRPRGDYKIRVYNIGFNQMLKGHATLSYTGVPEQEENGVGSKPYINRFGTNLTEDTIIYAEKDAVPFPPSPPAQEADDTFILDIGRLGASYLWTVNGEERYPEPSISDKLDPLLFSTNPSANRKLTFTTRNNTWVDLIIRSTPFNPPHPIHKHSNAVYVLGSGEGEFPYKTVAEAAAALPEGTFNLENPVMRDGWFPPPAITKPAWVAVRYHVKNPGPVFLHCHIQIHLTGGMAMTIMDGVDAWPQVPQEYRDDDKNGKGNHDDLSLFIRL